jgi:hypothetical protein
MRLFNLRIRDAEDIREQVDEATLKLRGEVHDRVEWRHLLMTKSVLNRFLIDILHEHLQTRHQHGDVIDNQEGQICGILVNGQLLHFKLVVIGLAPVGLHGLDALLSTGLLLRPVRG